MPSQTGLQAHTAIPGFRGVRNGTQNLVEQTTNCATYPASVVTPKKASQMKQKLPTTFSSQEHQTAEHFYSFQPRMRSAYRSLLWLRSAAPPNLAHSVLLWSIRKHSISHITGSQKYVLTEQQAYMTSKEACFYRAKKGAKAQRHVSSEPTFG